MSAATPAALVTVTRSGSHCRNGRCRRRHWRPSAARLGEDRLARVGARVEPDGIERIRSAAARPRAGRETRRRAVASTCGKRRAISAIIGPGSAVCRTRRKGSGIGNGAVSRVRAGRSSANGCRGRAGGRAWPRWRRGGARAGLCHEVELGLDLSQGKGASGPPRAWTSPEARVRPSARVRVTSDQRPAGKRAEWRGSSAIAIRSIMAGNIRVGEARAGDLIGADMPLGDPGGEGEAQRILRLRRGGGQAREKRGGLGEGADLHPRDIGCCQAMSVHQRRPWHRARHGPSGRSGRA
jgi:hypothetical protein